MRIDKFLKNARIIKRRTVGKDACDGGRVSINDQVAKPGDQVKPGDIITIRYGDGEQKGGGVGMPGTCTQGQSRRHVPGIIKQQLRRK